jgi:ubiquinone/menaquinone biosynthesis C-methylase UbiE
MDVPQPERMARMSAKSRYWDRIAQKYFNSPIEDEAAYQFKLAKTREYLTPESRVIEFGCGTGMTALSHAPFAGEILATDISEPMLELARQRVRDAGYDAGNLRFELADIDTYEGEEESFDVVLCLSLLHLVADRAHALANVRRLLKPGGYLISSTACLGDRMAWFALVSAPGRWLGLLPMVRVFREKRYLKELVQAGFRNIFRWCAARAHAVFVISRK